jgi:hypothetical protein
MHTLRNARVFGDVKVFRILVVRVSIDEMGDEKA